MAIVSKLTCLFWFPTCYLTVMPLTLYSTPIEILKRFYWEGYLIVKKSAPYWKYVMHDSFRLDPKVWGGL